MATPAATVASMTLRLVSMALSSRMAAMSPPPPGFVSGLAASSGASLKPSAPIRKRIVVRSVQRGADVGDQLGQWPRAVEAQYRAVQSFEPGLMSGEAAALVRAVLIMRGPFDESLGLLMPPAAGRHRFGSEMRGFA